MVNRRIAIAVLLLLITAGLINFELGPDSIASESTAQEVSAFTGQVTTSSGIPVKTATVHLVPTTAIDMTPITQSDINYPPFPAEAYDEPLEDAIAARGSKFPQAITDESGEFTIEKIPDGKFFIHVTPDAEDLNHLPGGDKSRRSVTAEDLRGASMTITISGRPPLDATYTGSTACLECHADHKNWQRTAHKLGWAVPGKPSPAQDFSRFTDYFEALESFVPADNYVDGTRLELGDRDSKRNNDKFKLRLAEDARLPINLVYADVYLWRSNQNDKYYITVENKLNPDDPNSPAHLEISMTYGGAVHRQRYIVSVPESLAERQGLVTVLQFHPDGYDYRMNRTRRVWRDYKFHYWWGAGADEEYGTADDLIQAPPLNTNTVQVMCAGCHVTGIERYTDADTGEILVRGVDDPNGAFNIDTDPSPDEVNVGCETCHGPGSAHVAVAGQSDEAEAGVVHPGLLSSERASVLCGRCHDRRQGVGGPKYAYTQAINVLEEFMLPGESRSTMLADYTDPAKKGPLPNKEIWPDDVHSRNPHQQYADFLKSGMYRNDRILVACHDCHDMHGDSPYERWLVDDPEDPNSSLCQDCHLVDINEHMDKKFNSRMKGEAGTTCIDCHMPGTAIAGGDAGSYARFINTPPFDSATHEKQNAYWEGHIVSHVFDVPRKTNITVKGVAPGDAMPIPYTNSCGTCHIVNELPYK